MAFRVAGKTAIVTGAGSGICFTFAKLLLDHDCNVVLADLALRPEAQALMTDEKTKARAVFQQTDVTQWQDLERMFEVAERQFGGVDIVCPGAGVYEPVFSSFWHPPGSPESKDPRDGNGYSSLDILLTHPIRATQLAISYFIQHRRPGAVVHISSIAAQRPILQAPLYVAAKSGLSNFIRCMAGLENPQNANVPVIRVNGCAPGVIKTPLWMENPEKLKWVDEGKDEWVEPEEVAEVMLALIEREEYVGGTMLEVGKNQTRRVEVLGDPGPSGAGHTVSDAGKGLDDVWAQLGSGCY